MTTTSIRLPDKLKQRLARAAENAGQTPQAFMLEAIAERVRAEEQRSAFQEAAEQRYVRIVESGETIPWSSMRELIIGRRSRGYVALFAP
ncbi:MAG: CopG family transcriptional regulator [Thiohalocapsa sp.]